MLAVSSWSHYLQPFSFWSLLPNCTNVIFLEHISDNVIPLVKPFCFPIALKLKSWSSNRLASLAHANLFHRSLLTPPHPTMISSLAMRNNVQLLGSPEFSFASGFSHIHFLYQELPLQSLLFLQVSAYRTLFQKGLKPFSHSIWATCPALGLCISPSIILSTLCYYNTLLFRHPQL